MFSSESWPFRSVVLLSALSLWMAAPVLLWGATARSAPAPGDTLRGPLIVGTKEVPPFAVQEPDGSWHGLSIELWEDCADALGIEYVYRDTSLEALISGVQDGTFDVALAALTITAEREALVDFSHPYFVSGLGIAVRRHGQQGWLGALMRLFSPAFLKTVLALFALLLVVGLIVWLLERRANEEQFGGSRVQGIMSGFWWSAVTMTTVGYGDKAPATLGGRIVALFWMFAGLIVVSSFTAAMTSALTVSQLESTISSADDLPDVQVATVRASTSEHYLQRKGIGHLTVATVEEGLEALRDERIDALVYDRPILKHLVMTSHSGKLKVMSETLESQYYGVALPRNSPVREALNRVLLEQIAQSDWEDTQMRYLGN